MALYINTLTNRVTANRPTLLWGGILGGWCGGEEGLWGGWWWPGRGRRFSELGGRKGDGEEVPRIRKIGEKRYFG